MVICLYNGQAYILDAEDQMEREMLIEFFEKGHLDDVIVIYDKKGIYRGCISYGSLLQSSNKIEAIICEKLFLEDCLWEKAQELLRNEIKIRLPVFDHNMQMTYLIKNESTINKARQELDELREYVDRSMLEAFGYYEEHIHIKGISDVLWDLRKWLVSLGIEVSVEGDEWKSFGIETMLCMDERAIVIDTNCAWLHDVYSKYRQWIKEDCLELEKLLSKSKIDEMENQDKAFILFYLSSFSYFTDSVSPLVFRYLADYEKKCVVLLPYIEAIIQKGIKNIRKTVEIVRKIRSAGGIVIAGTDSSWLYQNRYEVCYLCLEYSGTLPLGLRNASRYVVALQTTSIYVHMYRLKERFKEVFSEQAIKELDYVVTTEFLANWICARDKRWNSKILQFGNPKMDVLYSAFEKKVEIPDEWKKRILGKKVILFTTNRMEQVWLNYMDVHNDIVAIWRPHPVLMAGVQRRKQVNEICEKHNLILDDRLSYYESFQISDAHVAVPLSSITYNYLYMEKPICTYGTFEDSRATEVDYRQEEWYKRTYIALDEKDVLIFIDKIRCNEDFGKGDEVNYRISLQKNFDGKVCDRIYNFFEDF